MEISEEEAWIIICMLGDEDGEITEEEVKLEKRIRKEIPTIDEKLKIREHRDHLWEHEVEDDKRVKEARSKLNRHKTDWDILLKDLMNMKRKVLHEILEKEEER